MEAQSLAGTVELATAVDGEDELPLCHEMTTLEQLRALSDPLRVMLFRLLRERERTVKELCDQLGESSTRLYYHVGELERVGLVRLVRTEARAGIVQKYYRSVARFVIAPFTLFQAGPHTEEAQAAVDWWGVMVEQAMSDLRQAFSERFSETDPDTVFITRNYIRTTPERARELVRQLVEFQEMLVAEDDPDGPLRLAFTTVLAPASQPGATRPAGAPGRAGSRRPDAPHRPRRPDGPESRRASRKERLAHDS